MDERLYGRNKWSYGVTERPDAWIQLRVYHTNRTMYRLLEQHAANPRYFLDHRATFSRSGTSAKKWLAAVMDDYLAPFRENKVKIVLPPADPEIPSKEPQKPTAEAQPQSPRVRTTLSRGKVALVACVGKKRPRPMAAQDLYDSDWFRKASKYAKQVADGWYILSAKHGLIAPETVIEPYDETLKTMAAAGRRAWAGRVAHELQSVLQAGDEVVMLAGKDYREHLMGPIGAMGCGVQAPMEGLRIGEQLRWLNQRLSGRKPAVITGGRLGDIQRFYDILLELERRLGGKRTLAEADGSMGWPKRGAYFFFEPGEERTTSGAGLRIVRVGTHGLKTGSGSTLWGRLKQHKGTVGGSDPGGGNHRGSVFRLHVGSALIRRGSRSEAVAGGWGKGGSADRLVRERERPLERAVSRQIRSMPLLWVDIGDEPGPSSMRGYVERNAIALLSNCNSRNAPIDPPRSDWLGRRAAREAIRDSGLWNVNHVAGSCDPEFLGVLAMFAAHT